MTAFMRMATVYLLADAKQFDSVARVRYVGCTTSPLPRRLSRHRYTARRDRKFPVAQWIRHLEAGGGEVVIEAIVSVPIEEAARVEIEQIAKARQRGCLLLNQTAGGPGMLGHHASDLTRAKLRAVAVGRQMSETTRQQLRTAMLGRQVGPETRLKLSAFQAGSKSRLAKLTWATVREIRRRHASGENQRSLAAAFDVTWSTIYKVVHRQTWKEAA